MPISGAKATRKKLSSGSPITAVRGFGKIWCYTQRAQWVGNATTKEFGLDMAVQFCARDDFPGKRWSGLGVVFG